MSKPVNLVLLYGGKSGEHEVSLVSAMNVIQNLDRSRFEIVPIGIDKQGSWFLGDDVFNNELQAPAMLRLQRDAERMLFNPELIVQSKPTQTALTALAHSEMTVQRLFDVIFIYNSACQPMENNQSRRGLYGSSNQAAHALVSGSCFSH